MNPGVPETQPAPSYVREMQNMLENYYRVQQEAQRYQNSHSVYDPLVQRALGAAGRAEVDAHQEHSDWQWEAFQHSHPQVWDDPTTQSPISGEIRRLQTMIGAEGTPEKQAAKLKKLQASSDKDIGFYGKWPYSKDWAKRKQSPADSGSNPMRER